MLLYASNITYAIISNTMAEYNFNSHQMNEKDKEEILVYEKDKLKREKKVSYIQDKTYTHEKEKQEKETRLKRKNE